MKELKQSETRIVKRSEINLNPFNPKNHSDEEVKNQLKNLKKVGFNGGIKWNELSGNLIDGHRRIKAMDLYYKYDGSKEKDYTVKVEVVHFDDKTEKEQMTYEALGNTKANYELVSEYIQEIDYQNIGLSNEDIKIITSLSTFTEPNICTFDDLILNDEDDKEEYQEKKEAVKEMKQKIKDNAINRQLNEDAYITLSFSSHQAKTAFCQLIGIDPYSKYAKGEEVLEFFE